MHYTDDDAGKNECGGLLYDKLRVCIKDVRTDKCGVISYEDKGPFKKGSLMIKVGSEGTAKALQAYASHILDVSAISKSTVAKMLEESRTVNDWVSIFSQLADNRPGLDNVDSLVYESTVKNMKALKSLSFAPKSNVKKSKEEREFEDIGIKLEDIPRIDFSLEQDSIKSRL